MKKEHASHAADTMKASSGFYLLLAALGIGFAMLIFWIIANMQ